MIVLYILAGLLALIILLLCIPVQLEAKYSQELSLTIRYLFIPVRVLPKRAQEEKKPAKKFTRLLKEARSRVSKAVRRGRRRLKAFWKSIKVRLGIKEKPRQEPKEQPSEQKHQKSGFAALREERGFGGMVSLLWRIVNLSAGAFGKVLRGITVQQFDFTARIGGEDAADAAISYGKWCAVLYPALGFILGRVRKYKKNIDISPDFTGGGTSAEMHTRFRCIPILLLHHGLTAFLRLIFGEIADAVKQKMKDASGQTSVNMTQI